MRCYTLKILGYELCIVISPFLLLMIKKQGLYKDLKVRSHDPIFRQMFHLIFLFETLAIKIVLCEHKNKMQNVELKYRFKICSRPTSIRQPSENHIPRFRKEINNRINIEWKVGLCEQLTIDLHVPQMENCTHLTDCDFFLSSESADVKVVLRP